MVPSSPAEPRRCRGASRAVNEVHMFKRCNALVTVEIGQALPHKEMAASSLTYSLFTFESSGRRPCHLAASETDCMRYPLDYLYVRQARTNLVYRPVVSPQFAMFLLGCRARATAGCIQQKKVAPFSVARRRVGAALLTGDVPCRQNAGSRCGLSWLTSRRTRLRVNHHRLHHLLSASCQLIQTIASV